MLYTPGQNYVIVAYFLKHGTEDAEMRNKKTSTDNSFGPGRTVIFYQDYTCKPQQPSENAHNPSKDKMEQASGTIT